MAILIVLQNPGLAGEIGTSLRRTGRIVKCCMSVGSPEFLKEYPQAELIITDLVPPVLKFLSPGGCNLLTGPAPLLVIASRGHCANFATLLRSGRDRCLAADAGPAFLERVQHAATEMTAETKVPSATRAAESSDPANLPAKRVSADAAHEHRVERFARRAIRRQVQFVSDIAHDLRSPITAISEFAELMRTGLSGAMNSQQQRYVGIIERCCGEAARMVYDLLDGARLQSGRIHPHRQPIEVRSVLGEVVDGLEPAIQHSEIVLNAEIDPELPRVFADRDMLSRILANLVSNAIKFSPPRSTVTMRSERSSVSMARVSVIDSGTGISSADLRRIFHRFQQGSNHAQHGMGLGLAIVRELVKLHGGRVTVESSPGKGSRFHFTLPLFLPIAILRRHMAMRGRDGGSPASAWTFTFPEVTKYDAIHRLITASVRARDLVLPEDARRHIILVTQSKQPEQLIKRLLQQIASYGGTVPAVERLDPAQLGGWLRNASSLVPTLPGSTHATKLAG